MRHLDEDVARCIRLLPSDLQPDLEHLVRTLPPDDLMPIIRAAQEGCDDDAEATYLLGRLYERAIHAGYL